MRLFITEKPSAARSLSSALGTHKTIRPYKNFRFAGHMEGKGWIVVYLAGHFYEAIEPKDKDPKLKNWTLETLPILYKTIEWKPLATSLTIPVEEIHQQIAHISSLYNRIDEAVIATDAGQEGQLIGEVFLRETGWKGKTQRLWTGSWDESAIKKALNQVQPNENFRGYYDAAIARTLCDSLIGFNYTRLYTLKARQAGYNFVASTGRVRSAALYIVFLFDKKREDHQAAEYYSLDATLDFKGTTFKARLTPPKHILSDGKHCFEIGRAHV